MKEAQKSEIALLLHNLRRLSAEKQTEMYFMLKGAGLCQNTGKKGA